MWGFGISEDAVWSSRVKAGGGCIEFPPAAKPKTGIESSFVREAAMLPLVSAHTGREVPYFHRLRLCGPPLSSPTRSPLTHKKHTGKRRVPTTKIVRQSVTTYSQYLLALAPLPLQSNSPCPPSLLVVSSLAPFSVHNFLIAQISFRAESDLGYGIFHKPTNAIEPITKKHHSVKCFRPGRDNCIHDVCCLN